MGLSAVSAISHVNYQSALKMGAQAAAALQALDQTNANLNAPRTEETETKAPDALTQLAGSSALGALVNGVYSASAANGGNAVSVPGVNALGGVDASPVSTQLGGDPSGFPSLNLAASEALAAYKYQQSLNGTPISSSGAAVSHAQQVALTAQTSRLTSSVNLLT